MLGALCQEGGVDGEDREQYIYFLLLYRLPNPWPTFASLFSYGFKSIIGCWISHGYPASTSNSTPKLQPPTSNSKLQPPTQHLKSNSWLFIPYSFSFLCSLFQLIFPVTKAGKLSHIWIILSLASAPSVNQLPGHADLLPLPYTRVLIYSFLFKIMTMKYLGKQGSNKQHYHKTVYSA